MKISVLTVILIIISFIFYNEMTKHNYNVYNVIEENEENNIYNGNYIVSDNIILENSYDFNNSIETKEIRRSYLRWRDRENPNVDFEEDSKDLYVRLIIIFTIGCAVIGVLIEILFLKTTLINLILLYLL